MKKGIKKVFNIAVAALVAAVIMPAAAFGTASGDTAADIAQAGKWQTSKSKTATNLDEKFESGVTLSLPSAEEELVSDVVFVLDKSTSAALQEQALTMLEDLKKQIDKTSAQVKVGVVIFNKVANVTEFKDLATQYDEIEQAIKQEIKSGTNTHAGLLAGKKMLDEDTAVDNSRKYLIFVSDGITYMYNEEPTATAWEFSGDAVLAWAGPENWAAKYGDNQPPEDWNSWINDIGQKVRSQGTEYEYDYPNVENAVNRIPAADNANYANSIDKALYETYKTYKAAKDAGYKCYAIEAQTSSGAGFIWGPSFMNYLAGGENISFADIQEEIYYLLDAGSFIVDEIGCGSDYNFDFVNDIDAISLNVGGTSLAVEAAAIDKDNPDTPDGIYGFGKNNAGECRFVLEYYKNGLVVKSEDGEQRQYEECFVLHINEAVKITEPVQLTYKVRLTNPATDAGVYGTYDKDGSKQYEGLLTNKCAHLYPVDSNGNPGAVEEFAKPTVSYEVKAPVVPDDPQDNKPENGNEADTGDESNVLPALIAVIIAAVGIVVCGKKISAGRSEE